MNLKLGCYSTQGKFEGFKELGKDFGYFGEFILLSLGKDHTKSTGLSLKSLDAIESENEGVLADIGQIAFEAYDEYGTDKLAFFKRDEKDPLNRFNGLFNGRTFGNGRFVLVKEIKLFIPWSEPIWQDSIVNFSNWPECAGDENLELVKENFANSYKFERHEILNIAGNLHENPELFSKL